MTALVERDPFLPILRYTITHRHHFSLPVRPHFVSHLLVNIPQKDWFNNTVLSGYSYNNTRRLPPRFVTIRVLSEPQHLQVRTNHTARRPALKRHMPESGVGRLFFCFIGVARRVKAQGVYMP
jgi:hypothetical protein